MAVTSTSSRSAEARWSTPATRSRALAGDLGLTGQQSSPAPRVPFESAWVTAAFALALGLFQLRQSQIAGTWGLTSFPLDDSWIHFHFARNLAEGHGFAYNPGVLVAGSTAPLWTLVLAGGFVLLGGELYWAAVAGLADGRGAARAAA